MRAQTSTEYLIVVAVVIIIGITVVATLGGLPIFSGQMSESVARQNLASAQIAVSEYAINHDYTVLTLRNQISSNVRIDGVAIDDTLCTLRNTNDPNDNSVIPTLAMGESRQVYCFGASHPDGQSRYELPIAIFFTDLTSQANHEQRSGNLKLVGNTPPFVCPGGYGQSGYGTSDGYWWSDTYQYGSGLGSGTEDDPYQICSCAHLQSILGNRSAHYQIIADIDCDGYYHSNSDYGFKPVLHFNGTLDGRFHTISNLFVDHIFGFGKANAGIFDITNEGAQLRNIHIKDADVTGKFSGILVGETNGTTIMENIEVSGRVVGWSSTGALAGGIVGFMRDSSTLTNAKAVVEVSSSQARVGGVVGRFDSGTISNVYSYGKVAGNSQVGGLAGFAGGTINNAFSVVEIDCQGSNCSEIHGAIGNITGTISNIHWYDPLGNATTCHNLGDADCTQASGPDDFYGKTNEPMQSWNTNNWLFISDALPFLRGGSTPES